MLSPVVETIAAFLPSLTITSKSVSTVSTGFSYFIIPCFSGITPLYIEPKHTGVTLGITERILITAPLFSSAGANMFLYFSKIHQATASGL